MYMYSEEVHHSYGWLQSHVIQLPCFYLKVTVVDSRDRLSTA